MIDEVVILAAGMGSRMSEITHDRPKCMAPFHQGTILSRLLLQLKSHAPGRVHVIGGYKIDVLKKYLQDMDYFGLPVVVHENTRYATTNSLLSAEVALAKAKGQILLFNSDVVYDKELVRRMYESDEPFAFSLDRSDYNEESEKLSLDGAGRVVQIAKTITESDATGCSADLYRVNTEVSDGILGRLLPRFIARPRASKQLFEDYLDNCLLIQDFRAVDVTGLEWYEIDTVPELKDAERVFANIS